MRVISISVNGLANAQNLGLYNWLEGIYADIICIQDIRGRIADFEHSAFELLGYEAFFLDAENPENGGVMIYSRHMPKALIYGFSFEPADRQGRFLQADFENVSIATILAPCALGKPELQEEKDAFFSAFITHLEKTLRKRRQFIFAGNLQTAHLVMDACPRYHKVEESGFYHYERAWFDKIFDEFGYVDAFREICKDSKQYTWWPMWARGSRKQSAMRADYQIASSGIQSKIFNGFIDHQTRFSDHAPVICDYDIEMS